MSVSESVSIHNMILAASNPIEIRRELYFRRIYETCFIQYSSRWAQRWTQTAYLHETALILQSGGYLLM